MTRVIACAVPEDSLIASAFSRVDYADAFAATLAAGATVDVVGFTRRLFLDGPMWIHRLLDVRDAAVRLVGLKGGSAPVRDIPEVLEVGMKLGLFAVLARSEEEIMLGADDAHLDFRVSTLIRPTERGRQVIVATVVRYHGWAGRAYFTPVKPFHRIIVRALMRNALAITR